MVNSKSKKEETNNKEGQWSSFICWFIRMKDKLIKNMREIFPYIIIIVLILLVKKFIFGTVLVNGDSMLDTLHNGDLMILDKISYRSHKIERFDIVVVQVGKEKIIKRVIGLPGEVVTYHNNELYINGKKMKDPYPSHVTYDFVTDKIEKDSYFVMGDNRTNSLDSRSIGTVKRKNILGKAEFILYPFNRFGNVK